MYMNFRGVWKSLWKINPLKVTNYIELLTIYISYISK